MASEAINMSFRVDKNLKKEADKLFKALGMNTSVALNMFLKQSVQEQKLIFTPSVVAPKPSKELKKALKEAESIRNNPERTGYNTINEVIDALNE
ncbi:MAG: type II toxin-antitoxin system RelB/DinJ family antitoxin [Bacilli bacterium]|nr:type II toxin-antitoxin system RelB/DinJ family antitoxin [Bacilli bacterium]